MFRVACSEDDLYRAFCIRAIVFMGEQGCPYIEEIDGLDGEALHVLGEIDAEPVATGRIRFIDGHAKLERLAVLERYRGRGYGNQLLQYMMQVASAEGFKRFKLHAQITAIPFYERHGFRTSGPVFEEAGIPHRLMIFPAQA